MSRDGYHIKDGGVDASFAEMMTKLAAAWGTLLTEARIRIYAKALGDVEFRIVAAAASRSIRELKYFPTVSELRSFIAPSTDDSALIAWTAFGKAAETVGAYVSVDVDDGAAAFALAAVFGSWSAFCATEDGPGLALKRQEFMAAYRNAARTRRGPARLAGLCESSGTYPTGKLAPLVWAARITDGAVAATRERPRLEAGATHRAISEGADAQAVEGEAEARGAEGRQGDPPAG